MRTVPYQDILSEVLALAGQKPESATAADLAKIEAFIQRRGREAYQFYWWAETMLAEERDVEVDGDRVFVSLGDLPDEESNEAEPDPVPIGLVRGCFLDDPLAEPFPRPVAWVLNGDSIFLPGYRCTTVFVWFQRTPPADFLAEDAEIPAILRHAIAHAAYSDYLRPSAKTGEVPLEETAGYGFLADEMRKQAAMQRQAGRWTQN